MEKEEFLTTPMVAQMLGVTAASVNDWLKLGDFPNAFRLNPGRPHSPWRIPKKDVFAFIEKRRKERGFMYLPADTAKEFSQLLKKEPEYAPQSEPEQLPLAF